MKKVITITLVFMMLCCLFTACGGSTVSDVPPGDATVSDAADTHEPTSADDAVYTLSANFYASELLPPAKFLQHACDSIEELSDGRIQFDTYYNATLLGGNDSVSGCGSGVADVVLVSSAVMTEDFPLNSVMTVPCVVTPPAKSEIDAVFAKLVTMPMLVDELTAKNVMTVGIMSGGGYHAHGINIVLDTPEAYAGNTIECGGEGVQLIDSIGGNGTSMEVTDYYMSMSTGLLDGQYMHWGSLTGFGTRDFLNTHVILSNSTDLGNADEMYGGGFVTSYMSILMNIDSFNNLPEDLRQLCLEEFGKFGEWQNKGDLSPSSEGGSILESIEFCQARGDTFVFVNDEARKVWIPYIESSVDNWAKFCVGYGYTEKDCMAVYNAMMEEFDALN